MTTHRGISRIIVRVPVVGGEKNLEDEDVEGGGIAKMQKMRTSKETRTEMIQHVKLQMH